MRTKPPPPSRRNPWAKMNRQQQAALAAAHALAAANLKLIHFTIHRYLKIPPQDFGDACQQAYFALVRAAELYDPSRGQFSTYATNAIKSLLSRWHAGQSVVHVPPRVWSKSEPQHLRDQANKVRNLLPINAAKDVPEADQADALGPEESEDVRRIHQALRKINSLDRAILLQRMEGHTLADLAGQYGVTRERIRQRQNRAIERVREILGVAAGTPGDVT